MTPVRRDTVKVRHVASVLMLAAVGAMGIASPAIAQSEPSSTAAAAHQSYGPAAVTWGIESSHSTLAKCEARGRSYTSNSGYGWKCERQVTDHGVIYYLWTWIPS